MPSGVNPCPTLHLLVFVPTIPVVVFSGNSNGKVEHDVCENKDVVEEYSHLPLNTPLNSDNERQWWASSLPRDRYPTTSTLANC